MLTWGEWGGCFEKSGGYGNPLFIEHAPLGYDQSKDSEYLKYDRLRIIIENIDKTLASYSLFHNNFNVIILTLW